MTGAFGEDFAEDMSSEKEEIDQAFCDLGNSMSDACWNALPNLIRWYIAASCCSANQPSDLEDNAAGRDCGSDPCMKDKTCEECCASKGIGPDTPEGPGTDRPYGPGCTDRYLNEL